MKKLNKILAISLLMIIMLVTTVFAYGGVGSGLVYTSTKLSETKDKGRLLKIEYSHKSNIDFVVKYSSFYTLGNIFISTKNNKVKGRINVYEIPLKKAVNILNIKNMYRMYNIDGVNNNIKSIKTNIKLPDGNFKLYKVNDGHLSLIKMTEFGKITESKLKCSLRQASCLPTKTNFTYYQVDMSSNGYYVLIQSE